MLCARKTLIYTQYLAVKLHQYTEQQEIDLTIPNHGACMYRVLY